MGLGLARLFSTGLRVASLSLALFPCLAWTAPKPLDLELGKATVEELIEKYPVRDNGINAYSMGPMYEIDTSGVGTNGLKSALTIFNEKNVLDAVLLTFDANKSVGRRGGFEDFLDSLRKKYKLVKKNIPFVGNKSARFKDGNYSIVLESPHMSFDMTVLYQSNAFEKAFKEGKNRQERERKDNLDSLL